MLWRLTVYIIYCFYYTSNGQIVLVPLKEQLANVTANEKRKLTEDGDNPDSIKTLKAINPVNHNLLPSQWAFGSEGSPRWPHGQINYYIDSDTYGDGVAGTVLLAFATIGDQGDNLCPRFERLTTKPTDATTGSWLHFTNPDRVRQCVHDAGIESNGEISHIHIIASNDPHLSDLWVIVNEELPDGGTIQKIVLGYDCLKPREVLHTTLHGLGFRDEVTHPQRDLFIRVMWDNIQPAFRSLFRIQSVETTAGMLMEYDPLSIMHFHDRAFSLNGQPTSTAMLPGLRIEPSEELSHLDKKKIKRMFGHECNKRLVGNIIGKKCAKYGDLINDGNNNDNSGSACPNAYNDENQVVIPGNDVQENNSENDGDGDDQTVIPGDDVTPGGDTSGISDDQNEGNNGGNAVVIPGNYVENGAGDDKTVSGNDDGNAQVIPGNDVELNGAGNDHISGNEVGDNDNAQVIPGNDVDLNGAGDGQISRNEVDGSDNVNVIPGNDVKDGNDQMLSGDDAGENKVVVIGNNVKLLDMAGEELSDIEDWDDDMVDRKRKKLKFGSVKKLSGKVKGMRRGSPWLPSKQQ